MKKIFSLLLVLSSLNIFAANTKTNTKTTAMTPDKSNYVIATQFYINDKKVGNHWFKIAEGEKESVEVKQNFINIVSIKSVQKDDKKSVQMNFEVGRFNTDGEKIIEAKSSILTNENEMATMVFTSTDGTDTYKLEITPQKSVN